MKHELNWVEHILTQSHGQSFHNGQIAEMLTHYTVYRLQERYLQEKGKLKIGSYDSQTMFAGYPDGEIFPFKNQADDTMRHILYLLFLLTIKDKKDLGIFSVCGKLYLQKKYQFLYYPSDNNLLTSIKKEAKEAKQNVDIWKKSIHYQAVSGTLSSPYMKKHLPIIDNVLDSLSSEAILYLAENGDVKKIVHSIYTEKNLEIFVFPSNQREQAVEDYADMLIEAKQKLLCNLPIFELK